MEPGVLAGPGKPDHPVAAARHQESGYRGVRSLVAPGGTLLVIATAIADEAPVETDPPWLLKESEVKSISGDGLELTSLEHFPIDGEPNFGRWRAVFEW